MACQALGVVSGILADYILVRIVTCDATDTRVRAVEAPAVGYAIRLEPDGEVAPPVVANHGLP
jgi:hypothetical protein